MEKDEYIIVNKTTLLKRIDELRILSNRPQESVYDVDIEGFVLEELEQILSQSTPLIPENIKPLQELIDEGYDPYDSAHHLQVQRMLKVIQQYISNLKLYI